MKAPNFPKIANLKDIESLTSSELLAFSKELFIRYHSVFEDIQYIAKLDSKNFSKAISLFNHSKSQLSQDLFVLFFSDFKRNGYFVEFGAASGVELSNTYLLEKEYGWSGILVEPFPYWHKSIAKNRSCQIDHSCIASKSGDRYAVIGSAAPEESFIREVLEGDGELNCPQVLSLSLNDLLEKYNAPKIIDYISIDTEGGEFEILEAFNFNRYRVNIFTVEHNFREHYYVILDLMLRNGYVEVFKGISRWDSWYIHASLLGE